MDPSSSAELPEDALRFARDRLGPQSERTLSDPARRAAVRERMRSGADLEDAVLAEIHGAASEDRVLADEFVAYFLVDLMQLGGAAISPALHRHVDTGDLVQSVLGDLWPELAGVRFETRGRFLAFLSQRLDWKAKGKARKAVADRRREEERGDARQDRDTGAVAEPTPLSELAGAEDRDRIVLRLMKMSERDREILTLYLEEVPIDRIGAELGLGHEAARKALQRAIQRFRALP